MVTALAWDNARAFNEWIESVRMLRQSHDNDSRVILTFLENMPTPLHNAPRDGNGRDERLCCSDAVIGSYYQDENASAQTNEWLYDKPGKKTSKKEKWPSNSTSIADEQQTLEMLERTLELVGSR